MSNKNNQFCKLQETIASFIENHTIEEKLYHETNRANSTAQL